MNFSDPQITAGIIATGGVVVVAAVTTFANYVMDRRRERRDVGREATTARREGRAQSFAHRQDAFVDFSQSVASWASLIDRESTLDQWGGADFDTFARLEPKLELVKVYGSSDVRKHAELLFLSLMTFGDSTTMADWNALQTELEAYRDVVRADLDL